MKEESYPLAHTLMTVLRNKAWFRMAPLLVLLGYAGCAPRDSSDPTKDVAFLTGNTEPMRIASGVHLGMTARTLKKVRPNAQPAAYAGYSERIGDYEVGYTIPGSYSEGQVVPDGSRITGVSVTTTSVDDSVVTDAWDKTNRQLASAIPDKPRCVRLASKQVSGRAMLWRTKSVDILSVVATSGGLSASGADSARFYVFVGDSPFSNLKEVSKPCPAEGVWTQ